MTEPTTETGRAVAGTIRTLAIPCPHDADHGTDIVRGAVVDEPDILAIEAEAARNERIRLRHVHRLWHEDLDIPLGVGLEWPFNCHTCVLPDEPKEGAS